ncbi:acyltransferase family protein [Phenylobacterium sp.]|uniref:acyltransferase family protein n=1 Tax=Phenylobacterium sp. TaxID=1871053 RepID=UPI00356681E6
MPNRTESVQVLRFLAAALVAWTHISQVYRPAGIVFSALPVLERAVANIGSFGVDVFFVISGFVMAKTAPGKSPAEFMRLRLVRIVPIYWLATLAMAPFVLNDGQFTLAKLVSTLTFFPAPNGPLLQVGWTLCFEMLFYVVVALTLFRPRVLVPAALFAFAACSLARQAWGGGFSFFGNPLILEFLAGAAIYRLGARSRSLGLLAGAAALGIVSVLAVSDIVPINLLRSLISGDVGVQRVMLMGTPAALLVFAAVQFRIPRSPLSDLGDASYSLYLFHPPILAAALLLAPPGGLGPYLPLVFAVSVAVSLAAYRWLERPMMAFARPRPPRPAIVLAAE